MRIRVGFLVYLTRAEPMAAAYVPIFVIAYLEKGLAFCLGTCAMCSSQLGDLNSQLPACYRWLEAISNSSTRSFDMDSCSSSIVAAVMEIGILLLKAKPRGTIGQTSSPPPGSPVLQAPQSFIRQSLQLPQANDNPDARHTPLAIGIFGLSLLYEIAASSCPIKR